MEKAILTKEDYNQIFAKTEDVKVSLWHIHSLAELLVCKYRDLVDSKKLVDGGGFSSPILSIAELLTEKTETALNNIDEIEVVGNEILNLRAEDNQKKAADNVGERINETINKN